MTLEISQNSPTNLELGFSIDKEFWQLEVVG